MKQSLFLMKRLYLIRWINSALCFLCVLTGIFLTALAAYYEQISSFLLVPISVLWWLLIIPIFYLATEIGLLKIYRLARKLEKDNSFPYAQINRGGELIIFKHADGVPLKYQLTIIGNPMSFLDPRINFLEAGILIKSRFLGISIGLLTLILILLNIFLENIALGSNFLLIFIMVGLIIRKVYLEDSKK